jgi:hypothetical protein
MLHNLMPANKGEVGVCVRVYRHRYYLVLVCNLLYECLSRSSGSYIQTYGTVGPTVKI